MKIALFGASGNIGNCIAQEALSRGHQITGIMRNPSRLDYSHERLTAVTGDATDASSVASVVAGHDAVVAAINAGPPGGPGVFVNVAHALIEGLRRAGVKRLIVVGGAGSLEVAPGVLLLDSLPEAWKPFAAGLRDALNVYRTNTDLDWTFFSPAGLIQPGERTGKFRLGGDQLVTDANGESRISTEDYAVALVDELEHPQFIRRRFTIGY